MVEGTSPAQQGSVQLGPHPHASSDNPGTAAQLQFSPRQAARPSLIATGFTLAFAFGCLLSSVYGFLIGAWPFGVVEIIWCGVALRKFQLRQAQAMAVRVD